MLIDDPGIRAKIVFNELQKMKTSFHIFLYLDHRYLIEVDCSSGQFKSVKLKDKKYTINAPIFFTILQKKKKMDAPNF